MRCPPAYVPFPPSASAPPPPVAKSAREAKLRSEKKWGVEVMSVGFCILPSLLFRAQHRLGLKSTHLAVILQLAEFWWHDDKLPFPKKQTIADKLLGTVVITVPKQPFNPQDLITVT